MSKIRLFQLKNTLLIANFISNVIGVMLTNILSLRTVFLNSLETIELTHQLQSIFLPVAFALPTVLIIWYEQPIRRFLNDCSRSKTVTQPMKLEARQRLLNAPFVLIAINASIWLAAAIYYPTAYWLSGNGGKFVLSSLFMIIQGGLVTVTVAFFVLEFFLQHRLIPVFFPNGGISNTPRTFRIRIHTRLIAFLLACNLIPLFGLIRNSWVTINTTHNTSLVAQVMYESVRVHSLIYAAVGIWVTFLVSGNLTRSIAGMAPTLKAIREGRFDSTVQVTSNDELGYFGDVINEMAVGLKERDFIKETFGKYVSIEVRDEILSQRIPLDGELKDVTILFADLRNFTPLVEQTSPQEVVKIINRYFEEMEKIITAHCGLIVQFIGDEIEAVFGAPIVRKNHPDLALQAAMDMHRQIDTVNSYLSDAGYPPLSHGIGIHSGQVVAANIGSPQRLSYALVGDAVNVAARLQDLNKQFGTHIIASGATMERVQQEYPMKALPTTSLKGKSKGISLFGI